MTLIIELQKKIKNHKYDNIGTRLDIFGSSLVSQSVKFNIIHFRIIALD